MSKPTVFISGANGFIAQHIIKQLLDSNKFIVVGSVRDTAKAAKLEKDFGNDANFSTVIVEDLSVLNAFDEVFEKQGSEFNYILHTASPVNMKAKNNMNDLIVPALNGTKNIMNATMQYAPNVERFVLTSSIAAIVSPNDMVISLQTPLTEKSWNTMTEEEALVSSMNSYCYSKTLAERAAWDLHQEFEPKFTLSTINSGFVVGPQCFNSNVSKNMNASIELVNRLVHSKFDDPVVNTVGGLIVDVRDVAKAHVKCLFDGKLANHRLIVGEEEFVVQDLLDLINDNYPQLKGKIAKGVPGSGKEVMKVMPHWDNHISKELLGFKFISLKESLIASVDQIVEFDAKSH